MTSDSTLARFQANEGGAMVTYQWDRQGWLKDITLSGTGLFYHRSHDGLNIEIFQVGFGGAF